MRRARRLAERSDVASLDRIGAETPLRLALAAALAYPDRSMTVSGLRREGARGRLEIERVAGKDYTTLAAIERMRSLCRVQPKESDSGSVPRNETPTAHSASEQFGLFETDPARLARAALHKIAMTPSGKLGSTLQTNTNLTARAGAIRHKS